ncbi:hypothetical protein C8Q76DRAFT_722680 [Earliella scabrosa]|nr:hypothetical protein C8Q76DRAFT_722680 [Earliella scabrosa]
MSATDLVLRIEASSNPNADARTVRVYQIIDESQAPVEVYKFHHPNIGLTTGVTSMQRKNAETQLWENAGQIEWTSNTSGAVYFGVERVSIRELRKPKKPSSKSRRFKANGAEYKWKLAENGTDMICVSDNLGNRGKTIAQWTEDTLTLRVTERGEGFLDRIVTTCLLHLWLRRYGVW